MLNARLTTRRRNPVARGTRERALPGQVHLFRTFFLKAIPVAKTPSVTVKKRVFDDNLIWLSSSQARLPDLYSCTRNRQSIHAAFVASARTSYSSPLQPAKSVVYCELMQLVAIVTLVILRTDP